MGRRFSTLGVVATVGVLLLVPVASGGFVSTLGAAAVGAAEPVVRDCRTSVYGGLGDWKPESVLSGPLGFVRVKAYERSRSTYFRSVGNGRYKGLKLLSVVRTGWQARIVVPAHQRSSVALVYDPGTFNTPVVPTAGVHEVTFTACPPRRPFLGPRSQAWTQFNGEIVVARRRCVLLDVYAAKQGDPLPSRPLRVRLGFGVRCPR